MRYSFGFIFPISAALSTLLTILIVLGRVVFATQAGEAAFESDREGNWEIYLLDLQTGITHNLTHNPYNDLTPSWSPDGSQIAFVSDREGNLETKLYVMNENGSQLRRASSDVGVYRDPTWTTDGHSLVLTHDFEQIYRLDENNGAEQWLGVGFAPRLSPDGTQIVYYANGTSEVNSHIYLFSLTTHLSHDLTPGPTHNWNAKWSPDGRQMVFASSRDDRIAIYSMNADGSGVHAITSGDDDVTPAWSPDGKQIIYASGANGAKQLYVVNADGTNLRQLTASPGDSDAPVWRPQSR